METTFTSLNGEGQQPRPVLKVKKLSDKATLPTKNLGDAGYDLYASEDKILAPGERAIIPTDISMEIPSGHVGLIWPRSGLSAKKGIDVLAGVIDSTYRGAIGVVLLNTNQGPKLANGLLMEIKALNDSVLMQDMNSLYIKKGDKIAQILIQEYKEPEIVEASELSSTERGAGGFGSTGR